MPSKSTILASLSLSGVISQPAAAFDSLAQHEAMGVACPAKHPRFPSPTHSARDRKRLEPVAKGHRAVLKNLQRDPTRNRICVPDHYDRAVNTGGCRRLQPCGLQYFVKPLISLRFI
jgi:hypothetical protein